MTENSRAPSCMPGWAYVLVYLGGSLSLLPWLGFWRRPWAKAGVLAHALLPFALPWVLPLNWLFIAAFWLLWNTGFGLLLLVFKPPQRSHSAPASRSRWLLQGLGATLCLLPAGFMLVALEQWVSDALWSGFYPVNASLSTLSFEVLALWQNFALLLALSAIHAARTGHPFTPIRLSQLLLISFAGYFAVSQAFLGSMAIPMWQLMDREVFPNGVESGRQALYHLLTFITLPLLTASIYRRWQEQASIAGPWSRGLAAMILGLLGLGFATGMPIYYALLLGMEQEKAARPEQATPWYGRALTWSRSDKLNAYLQFHMGLLWRKQGRLDLAHEAFLRVLIRYPHGNDLLVMAHEFESKLQKPEAQKAIRKVIPGIEMRTEYKNAYCVPNSLGLVLNYWGDRTGAKEIGAEITQLDQGSFITDALHFTERRGLKALVLPLRDLEDVFRLIDKGYPVLTFIPGHVLAVFGYDRALETLVTYDVNTVDIWDDQRWAAFQKDWSLQFNTLAIVAPESRLPELRQLLGEDAESKSEAYVQYLLAGIRTDDIDDQARYLANAGGHGLFFASWERDALLGQARFSAREDSLARAFLLRYSLTDVELMAYMRSLYGTGHCPRALDFIADYQKENPLGQSLHLIRAGCLAQAGKADSAASLLVQEIDLSALPSRLLHFLFTQPSIRRDYARSKPIAMDALNLEDGMDGETAGLAMAAYLEGLDEDMPEVEESLGLLESYVTRHNPYDTAALLALERLGPRKLFRSDDEWNREGFEKRLELYRMRRESLTRW